MAKLEPISPGENLLEGFMKPAGISQIKLARDIDVPVGRISEIIHGKRGITTDPALRLSVHFSTTPEFRINLQTRYDLKLAKENLLPAIDHDVRPLASKAAQR